MSPKRRQARYFCFWENPEAREVAGLFYHNMSHTDEDGSYRIPVLPGRGLITVRDQGRDRYIMGVGIEKIKGGRLRPGADFLNTSPHHLIPTNYHVLVEISPKPGDESITCDVALVRGRSLKGRMLDPDGRPLDGVRVLGLNEWGYWLNTGAEFTVESLQPNKRRVLHFMHDKKKLAGYVVLRGDEKTPLEVRLKPWCTLTGRLVALQGEPVAGANVGCGSLYVQTGKDGRFRIEGLVDGVKFDLSVTKDDYVRHVIGGEPKGLTIKAGETKDLGDLCVKPAE